MQKLKRIIKKVAAIAGSAIMATSLVTPAMAATLADLPRPFISTAGVFDANVIVGSQTWNALVAGDPAGVASDLAGAIDVAAAFAQQAKAAAAASGTVTLTRPQTPGILLNSTGDYLSIGGSVDANTPTANTFNNSKAGFEWLINETRVYNSTDYPIWESLFVRDGNLDTTGLFRSYGGVEYRITSNGSAVPQNFNAWPIFGENYQIISAGSEELRFGQIETQKNVGFGQIVQVGDKATVVVSDWNTANSKARVTIRGADGHIWVDEYNDIGTVFDNTTNGYTITLKDVVISTILGNFAEIEWSASSLSLKNGTNVNNASVIVGMDSPLANWTVNFDVRTDGLYSLSFTSPVMEENGMISLSKGESLLEDHFNIKFEDWNLNNYTSITFRGLDGGQGADLIYTNNATNTVTKNINLDPISGQWTSAGGVAGFHNSNKSNTVRLITGLDNYRFQYLNADLPGGTDVGGLVDGIAVWVGSENIWNLTAHNATMFGLGDNSATEKPWAWATFNTSGAWYNISFDNISFNISITSWTSNSIDSYTGDSALGGEFFGDKLAWAVKDVHEYNSNATYSGTLTLTENDGKTIQMAVVNNKIDKVDAPTTAGVVNVGTTRYTHHGTEIKYSASDVVLSYPENRRTAKLWIGRSASESTSFAVGETISGTTWEVESVGAGGSPAINAITPGIGAIDTTVVFTSLAKPSILVGGASVNKGVYELGEAGVSASDWEPDRAYFQLVENAFGSGKTVLVIAGYEARDTKLACQVMAAKIAGLSTISLTGDLVWLDTSGSTYSQVTVVQ